MLRVSRPLCMQTTLTPRSRSFWDNQQGPEPSISIMNILTWTWFDATWHLYNILIIDGVTSLQYWTSQDTATGRSPWIINVCFPGWVSFSQSVTSLSACTRSLYQVYLLVPVSLSLSPQCAACPGVILHCCTWPPPRATLSRLLTPNQLTSPWLKNISYLKSWSKLTVKMN